MTSAVLMRQKKIIKPFYRHSGDWGARHSQSHNVEEDAFDGSDKKIVNSQQDRALARRNIAALSVSLENLKNGGAEAETASRCDKFSKQQTPRYNHNGGRPLRPRISGQQQQQGVAGEMKKSPSTPNLNWRYAVAEEAGLGDTGHQAVRRRQRKVARPRPRSEIRERTYEETWVDGDRDRRPASYVDTGRVEKDYYIQTCSKPSSDNNNNNNSSSSKAPSLPRPVLSGLVWHQTSGLFSRWREVFLLLTRDCVRAHKISGHNKNAQFGGLLFSLDLVLVTDVRYVERRGYLTLCVEGQGMARTYLRRTEGIKEWGKMMMDCVKRKKDEFERDMSPCDLLRYPRPLMQLQPDSWLLSRLSPNTMVQNVRTHNNSNNNNNNNSTETETDSGLDSLEEAGEKRIEVEEMQEVKLRLAGGKCYNMSSRHAGARPRIPTRLCKVTRV